MKTKEQQHTLTITLELTYAELQTLLALARGEVQHIERRGTVSDWHEVARSLCRKVELEACAEV